MRIQRALAALAFSATVAATFTGLTLRAETREAPVKLDPCASADWPRIPAACLEGGRGYEVRTVGADVAIDEAAFAARFTVAIE